MTIKTEQGERAYEYAQGYAWTGSTWKGDQSFPFAAGKVYGAWQEPYVTNPEHTFEATRDLITWHTEKFAGRYEIHERMEGQERSQHVGTTLTAWGAKRKIAKRISEIVNRITEEVAIAKFLEGRSTQ